MTKRFTNADETQELRPYEQDECNEPIERTTDGAFRSRPLWRNKYPDGSCRPVLTSEARAVLAQERGEHVSHNHSRP
jgi:hypothetical protein